jgi:hypothetical protein
MPPPPPPPALHPFCWACPPKFRSIFFTVGLLGRGISPSQGRYLHTGQYKQNKRTQKSMPWVGFEPMIPAFERTKTVHASDRAATVIGRIAEYGKILPVYIERHTTKA